MKRLMRRNYSKQVKYQLFFVLLILKIKYFYTLYYLECYQVVATLRWKYQFKYYKCRYMYRK